MRVAGDRRVMSNDSLSGIDNDQHNVRHADISSRHHNTKLFRHLFGLAFAADSGGIDEDIFDAIPDDGLVNGIARSSGDRRNDRPFTARSERSAAWICLRSGGR